MEHETHAAITPPKREVSKPHTQHDHQHEEKPMSATQNFFDNPMGNAGAGGTGLAAGFGGLIGAALGNGNGLFGGNKNDGVTADQVDSRFNSLQATMDTNALQAQLGRVQGQIANASADSTIALGAAISGVKDAVTCASAQNQLALCGLGHAITHGNASVIQAIQAQGAAQQLLTVQQALDAERARATELRIALSEHKNQAGHNATQVLLNQVISAK